YDREARAEMFPGEDTVAALDQAAAEVAAKRRPGLAAHPANTLVKERWLRAVVVARPDLVGAAHLEARPTARPRRDLSVAEPAPAVGVLTDGTPVTVVCSTGVDLDLVPTAAELRQRDAAGSRLLLAVPAGDDYPVTRRLAAALAEPAEVVAVPSDWARRYPE
ncbi:MAG TPA: hypothetical protein VKV06_11325, partial [Acidimicrobiales bacterium]|nr:hypothetical protein [Acidimicrobiales bacterium]